MANCLPFNAVLVDDEYDRMYKAEDWAWYFATFIANGVFPKPSDGLQVAAYSEMKVRVNAGYAFINGYAYRNPAPLNVTLDRAEGAQSRIDRIIVRWDLPQRDIYIAVLKGVPSAKPVATAVTRNTEIWELALADIYVGKGVTKILTQNITDQRFNSAVCGIVTGILKEIDASVLTRQFNDFFDTYSQRVLSDFEAYKDKIEEYGQNALSDLEAYKTGITENEAKAAEAHEAFTIEVQKCLDGIQDSFEDYGEKALAAFEMYKSEIAENEAKVAETYAGFSDKAQKYLDRLQKTGDSGLADLVAELGKYQEDAGQRFEAWFENLETQLSGDVAGNLQNEVNSLRAVLREITESEIDEIIGGTYESAEGGIEPDIYSRVTAEEIEGIVEKTFGGEG